MIYRILLGDIFPYYSVDKIADRILSNALLTGIVSYGLPPGKPLYPTANAKHVLFGNGVGFSFLCDSHSFLEAGMFQFPDGFEYQYRNARCGARATYIFKWQLSKFKERLIEGYLQNDQSDFV